MPAYKVIITESAEREIDSYFDYIALDSVQNAVTWHANIYEKIATLSDFALRCPIATENPFFDFEIRCFVIGEYRTLYRIIEDDVVEVQHVKHPRMNR